MRFARHALILAAAVMPLTGPALATPASGGWTATLSTPLATPRQAILNSVVWKCSGAQCNAPAQDSRPQLVCQKVARKFGAVARFTSPEGELGAEELAKCNG